MNQASYVGSFRQFHAVTLNSELRTAKQRVRRIPSLLAKNLLTPNWDEDYC